LRGENAEIRSQLVEAQKATKALKMRVSALEEQVAQANARADDLEARLQVELGSVSQMADSRDVLTDQNRRLAAEVTDLGAKLRALEQERDKLDASRARSDAEAARLKQEVDENYDTMLNARARVAELEAMVTMKDAQITDGDDEINTLKRDFQRQRDLMAATAAEALASAGASGTHQMAELQAELEAAQARAEQLRLRHDATAKELMEVENEKDELEEALALAVAEAEQNSRSRADMDSQISALQRRLASRIAEVDLAASERNIERDHRHRIERELITLQLRIKELEFDAVHARDALDDGSRQRSRRAGVGDKLRIISAAVDNARKGDGDNPQLKAQLDRANANAQSLEDELETARAALHAEERKWHTADAEMQAALNRAREAKTTSASLQVRVTELVHTEQRCSELQISLAQLRAEHDALQAERQRASVTHRGLSIDDDDERVASTEKDAIIRGLQAALKGRNVQVSNLQTSVKDLLHRWPQETVTVQTMVTPPQSPPPAAKQVQTRALNIDMEEPEEVIPTHSRTTIHPILRLDGVQVATSDLASQIDVTGLVDIELSDSALTVISSRGRVERWPLDLVKRYGIERNICSIEFGSAAELPGVLYFVAGLERGELLFRSIEKRLQSTPSENRAKIARGDVHTFTNITVLTSALSDNLALPAIVALQLSPGLMRVTGDNGSVFEWASRDIKRYGILDEVCSVEVGASRASSGGTLFFNGGGESTALLRAIRGSAERR
jgi:hypothetical protein